MDASGKLTRKSIAEEDRESNPSGKRALGRDEETARSRESYSEITESEGSSSSQTVGCVEGPGMQRLGGE